MRPSLVFFKSYFRHAVKQLPHTAVEPIDASLHTLTIQDTRPYKIVGRDSEFAMSSISTYPVIAGVKQGEPLADRVAIERYRNATFAAVCDGCGWGTRAAGAASVAAESALDYVSRNLAAAVTVRALGRLLVRAACWAHDTVGCRRLTRRSSSGT